MRPRHPVPTRWLFVDDRLGGDLWRALRRLPPGSGVVFRARDAAGEARYPRVRRIARARQLVLLSAGRRRAGADGIHNAGGLGLRSLSIHSWRDLQLAKVRRPNLLFVSPIFATRSHPGAPTLGRRGFARLARGADAPVVALGGMSERRWRRLPHAHGWAGIDGWIQRQDTGLGIATGHCRCERIEAAAKGSDMSDTKVKGPASYFPSIEKTYGRPIAEWQALVQAHMPAKHMQLVSMLKEQGMGHGHANAVVAHVLGKKE